SSAWVSAASTAVYAAALMTMSGASESSVLVTLPGSVISMSSLPRGSSVWEDSAATCLSVWPSCPLAPVMAIRFTMAVADSIFITAGTGSQRPEAGDGIGGSGRVGWCVLEAQGVTILV